MDSREKAEINYKRSLEAVKHLNSVGIIDTDMLEFYENRIKNDYNETLKNLENISKPRPNADIIYGMDRPEPYIIRYSCPFCGRSLKEGDPCCNCEIFFDWSKKATINKYKNIIEWE